MFNKTCNGLIVEGKVDARSLLGLKYNPKPYAQGLIVLEN